MQHLFAPVDAAPICAFRAVFGALMLVHGMIDENVHFRHTARLATARSRPRAMARRMLPRARRR